MALSPDALAAETALDPLALGYAGKGDGALAALLNAPNAGYTAHAPQLPLTALLKWAAGGPAQKLQDYAAGTANNAALRSACLAALQVLAGSVPYLDVSDAQITGLLAALVAGGVLASGDQAALLALADRSPASRAEVLWGAGAHVTPEDVRRAQGRAS